MKNMMTDEAPLFMQHERFRRVERLFRAGYKDVEIAQRERIPLHVVRRIMETLIRAN